MENKRKFMKNEILSTLKIVIDKLNFIANSSNFEISMTAVNYRNKIEEIIKEIIKEIKEDNYLN